MATKTEMVTFILDNSEEYTQAYLESLSYKKIKTIFNDVETIKIIEPNLIDTDGKFMIGDDDEDNEIIEEDNEEDNEIIEEEVEEVWSYENLSPNDQRLYRRTGIKRISKSKKYTRFNEEEPKI